MKSNDSAAVVVVPPGQAALVRGVDRLLCDNGIADDNRARRSVSLQYQECSDECPFEKFSLRLLEMIGISYVVNSLGAPYHDVGNDADLEANPDPFGDLHRISDGPEVAELVGIALGLRL
jgi:hypothetical protein